MGTNKPEEVFEDKVSEFTTEFKVDAVRLMEVPVKLQRT
jgi:hypothetical protein